MVDVTASLDAATQQVLALLAQIRLGNVRFVQAQDLGAADAYVFAPVPNVASYGADLVLVADIAAPNLTTSPKLTIQGLGTIPIQAADGSAPAVGSVAGKRLIGFSSIGGGGFAARLLGLAPADIQAILQSAFYATDTGAVNTLAVTLAPAPTTYGAGGVQYLFIKVANNNTGAASINVNAIGPRPIVNDASGDALIGGELLTGKIVLLAYDGTSFRLLTPFATVGGGAFGASGILGATGTTSWTVPLARHIRRDGAGWVASVA